MKYTYYILSLDERYHALYPSNWYGKGIRTQDILTGNSKKIPNTTVFYVEEDSVRVQTDIITKPFFLISESFKQLLSVYEPMVRTKKVIFIDREKHHAEIYYLPILAQVEWHKKSEWNMDRSVLRNAVLEREKIRNSTLFMLENCKSQIVVIRSDLLESCLKREFRGFHIIPVTVIDK